MSSILAVAPHPDDETLGCGGTLLRHVAQGDEVHWLIVTDMQPDYGYSPEKVSARQREIATVAAAYRFSGTYNLKLRPGGLDALPQSELVARIGEVIGAVRPAIVYLPFRQDVHTDHLATFDAVVSCTKWFRYSSVQRVLCYETLSETDFGLDPAGTGFRPNFFVDISSHLPRKLDIIEHYHSEVGAFPFPRSREALIALARVRGAASGCEAAEAFQLLRHIEK